VAAQRGLILVDTKYEFGKDSDGVIRLIDEINTVGRCRLTVSEPVLKAPMVAAHAGTI
jgi:phosphoribosylaminoimidazole-succinocarboxamide synthase